MVLATKELQGGDFWQRLLSAFFSGAALPASDSVNIELDSREHCWVELDDLIPGTDMTFLDWFKSVVE